MGNARSFLIAWLSVRQQAGRMLLRIEDIDSPRVKAWAAADTMQLLQWLGLDWDYGPDNQAEFVAPLTQTQRLERYRAILEDLIQAKRVYPCFCTRSEIAAAASAPHEQSGALEGPIYPGTCRTGTPPPEPDQKYAWRWALQDAPIDWLDHLAGPQSANPLRQLGDFVVAKQDATPAYQLAVVVDDFDMGVTEVVRGDDLIFSTYRQRAIQMHFNWTPPSYYHLPLMIGPDGRRLAKRHGDTRLSYFRDHQLSPEAIVGYLAWTAGLLPSPRKIAAQDLIHNFDFSRLTRQVTVVDQADTLRLLKSL